MKMANLTTQAKTMVIFKASQKDRVCRYKVNTDQELMGKQVSLGRLTSKR